MPAIILMLYMFGGAPELGLTMKKIRPGPYNRKDISLTALTVVVSFLNPFLVVTVKDLVSFQYAIIYSF